MRFSCTLLHFCATVIAFSKIWFPCCDAQHLHRWLCGIATFAPPMSSVSVLRPWWGLAFRFFFVPQPTFHKRHQLINWFYPAAHTSITQDLVNRLRRSSLVLMGAYCRGHRWLPWVFLLIFCRYVFIPAKAPKFDHIYVYFLPVLFIIFISSEMPICNIAAYQQYLCLCQLFVMQCSILCASQVSVQAHVRWYFYCFLQTFDIRFMPATDATAQARGPNVARLNGCKSTLIFAARNPLQWWSFCYNVMLGSHLRTFK